MSFFDEGDDEPPSRTAHTRSPRPRRPLIPGALDAPDRQTLLVRRAVAAGGGVLLLILIILGISSCVHSQKISGLRSYNRRVSTLVAESDQQVAHPFFMDLSGAKAKSPLDVEVQVNQLRITAEGEAQRAAGLDVPGGMGAAQRNLLLTLHLRSEGVAKVANLIRAALGSQTAQDATNQIAGDMELFLASDVIYAERVAPLIGETLRSNGIHDQTTATTRFLPNLGWLSPSTVSARIGGQASPTANGPVAPGTHGHGIGGVSVGSTALSSSGVNRVAGGANPVFTVMVANQGSNDETNVKADVVVTGGGKTLTATKTIDKTKAGTVTSVAIPVSGVPLGVPSKVIVNIEAVPGEKNLTNNKGSFTVVFGR